MTYSPRWPPGTPGRIRRRAVERTLADRLEAALARPAAQQPGWPDPDRVRAVVRRLTAGEPLVTPAETRRLLDRLGAVARGEALLLQSGDCAETFAESTEPHLRANLGLLRRMALVLTHAAGLPVVTVARAAGQYAKPRSAAVDAHGLPVYRGDIVNSAESSHTARTPDPERMARAHHHAREAMTVVRRLAHGDLADAHALHEENHRFVSTAPGGRRHRARAAEIGRGLRFMTGVGAPAPASARSGPATRHCCSTTNAPCCGPTPTAPNPGCPADSPTSCGSGSAPGTPTARTSPSPNCSPTPSA